MNVLIITILLLASFTCSIALFFYALKLRSIPVVKIFLFLMTTFSWIALCSIIVLLHQDLETKILFSRLRFLAFPFISPLCFFLSTNLFLEPDAFFRRFWVKPLLLFIPIFVVVMILVPEFNDLFTLNYQPFITAGAYAVQFNEGILFSTYYSAATFGLLLTCALLLTVIVKGKKNQKKEAFILLFVSLAGMIIDMAIVKSSNQNRWLMLSAGAHVVYELGIAFAIFRYGLMGLVPHAQFKKINAKLMTLVAHDLASNVRALSSLSSSITSKNEHSLEVHQLNQSIASTHDFLGNLLHWMKTRSTEEEFNQSTFEMNTLLRECVDQMQLQIQLRPVEVSVEFFDQPILIQGDSEMITSVVRNILSNAIRYSDINGKIEISSKLNENEAYVSIRDYGIGMESVQVSRILGHHEFFDLKSGANAGYGIGMALSREFLELHGAKLLINSVPNKGTEVTFQIPILNS